MQGYEAALPELGIPDEHAIGSDVFNAQPDGLRHAQSGAGEQGKERAIRLPPERLTGVSYRPDESDDIVRGKDIGGGPCSLVTAKDRRRQFVVLILNTDVPGEPNDLVQAVSALVDRSGQSGPRNGGLTAHMFFTLRLREGGKTAQEIAWRFESKSARTANGEVGLDELG